MRLALLLALGVSLVSCDTRRSSTAAKPAVVVDINSATIAELKALPEIGDAYAERIVRGRPYENKRQLVSRGILTERTYDKIAPMLVAHQRP